MSQPISDASIDVIVSTAPVQNFDVTEVDVTPYTIEVSGVGAQGPKGDSADSPDMFGAGMPVFDRRFATGNVAMTSGLVRLTYFTAVRSETIRNIAAVCGSTAAVGATLVRMGIYAVAGDPHTADGDLTLIGSTANDTTLFVATNTRYVRALSAAINVVKGTRYAFGAVGVWSTAANLFGVTSTLTTVALLPRIGGQLPTQVDLPASIPAASLALSNGQPFAEILP